MPRYKLTLEYDGTPFVGWQVQGVGQSVQGRLAEAIAAFTGEQVMPHGAGRTDAGVHALGQVAHIDLARDWPSDTVREALNAHLRPDPIAVLAAELAPAGFDARFSAIARHYLYRFVNRRAPLALERSRAWRIGQSLDAEAMGRAAQALVGRHDFTTFRAAGCQARSPVKSLDRLVVTRAGEEIRLEASARSFLHRQVRSMAGSLKLVGEGKWREQDIAAALAARDRARCGALAPPHGLYLVRVDYPAGA
jgi:tRNA pseudouridine38-40 synthase